MFQLKANNVSKGHLQEVARIERQRISDAIELKYGFDTVHLNRALKHFELSSHPELEKMRNDVREVHENKTKSV